MASDIPVAVASQIAHQFGKDVVLLLSLSHANKKCKWVTYGRSPLDKDTARRLSETLQNILAEQGILK